MEIPAFLNSPLDVLPFATDGRSLGNAVAECLARGARVKACLVVSRDQSKGRLKLAGAYGASADFVRDAAPGDDAINLAACQGHPVEVSDLANDTGVPYHDLAREEGLASLAAVPMILDGAVVGVAHFFTNVPHRFTRKDLESLAAQAQVAALALEHARLYRQSRVLFELAQTVSGTLDLRQVGSRIAEAVAKAMSAKGCSVRLLDEMRHLQLVGAYGLSREYLEKGPIRGDVSIAEALQGRPVIILDAPNDPRLQYPEAARAEAIASLASVPMVLKGVVTGVLRVYTTAPRHFVPAEVELLKALASVGAAALENARLYDGIQRDFEVLMDEIVYLRQAGRTKS